MIFRRLALSVFLSILCLVLILISFNKKKSFLKEKNFYFDGVSSYIWEKNTETRKIPVNLRVVVMTYNRPISLNQTLYSVRNLELDGESLQIEIWIDRNSTNGVNEKVVAVSEDFVAKHPFASIHIHPERVGLYGQWTQTYDPSEEQINFGEKVLFLEDDQTISKVSYFWIKKIHQVYGNEPDFCSCTLRSFSDKAHNLLEKIPTSDSVIMHRAFSTHAVSPNLRFWKRFLEWFSTYHKRKHFKPYVPNIKQTIWYKTFESSHTTSRMWSMWIYYYIYIDQVFSVYPNPTFFNNYKNGSYCFDADRAERGLHSYGRKSKNLPCNLIENWEEEFIKIPKTVFKIEWDGTKAKY